MIRFVGFIAAIVAFSPFRFRPCAIRRAGARNGHQDRGNRDRERNQWASVLTGVFASHRSGVTVTRSLSAPFLESGGVAQG